MEGRGTGLTTDELAAAGRFAPPDDADASAPGARQPADTPQATSVAGPDASTEPLLAADDAQKFRESWERVQNQFVDQPRQAVENADRLVAELMQDLAGLFAQERESLEREWGRDGQPSTEDLRVALQRYRSFFKRLLST